MAKLSWGRLRAVFMWRVPKRYDRARHYNCFVETAPARDRQAVYQELRRRGLIRYAHKLSDGRRQLGVINGAEMLAAYNAVAHDKRFAAGLTKARLIELMVSHPDMRVTALLRTSQANVDHAENIALGQVRVASEGAFRQGVRWQQQGQHQRAVEAYDRALAIEPEDIRAWHNKIIALAQLGERDSALAVAEQALARHANIGLLWEAKGRALALAGRLVEAGECLSRAAALNPAINQRHSGAIDQQADRWFQGLLAEARSAGKDPESDLGFWWAKFEAAVQAGSGDKALLCLQMAARLRPDYWVLHDDTQMRLLPPDHWLFNQDPVRIKVDATAERLGDFFQRMTTIAMNKGK